MSVPSDDVKGSKSSSPATQGPSGSKLSSSVSLTNSVILDYLTKNVGPKLGADGSCKQDNEMVDVKTLSKAIGPSTDDVLRSKLSQLLTTAAPEQGNSHAPSAMRKTIRRRLNQVELILPVSAGLTNGATNVLSGIVNVDPTASTEWSSLQQLYDEYRLVGGVIHFTTLTTAQLVGAATSDTMLVLCYDPVDNTALTNTRNGCELSQHKLFAFPVSGSTAVAPGASPYEFRWNVPLKEGVSVSSTGTLFTSPGVWKNLPSNGSNGSTDGFIKSYWTNAAASAANVIGMVIYYRIQFRSRK